MNKKILTTAISLLFVSSVGAQRGNTRWTAEGISLNRPVPELRRTGTAIKTAPSIS